MYVCYEHVIRYTALTSVHAAWLNDIRFCVVHNGYSLYHSFTHRQNELNCLIYPLDTSRMHVRTHVYHVIYRHVKD